MAVMRISTRPWPLLLPLLVGSLRAQAPAGTQHTTLRGTVTGSAGRPLAGAQVRLMDAGAEISVTRTEQDGGFVVAGIIRGRSRLQVRSDGFKDGDLELFFPRDSTRALSIELEPAGTISDDRDSTSGEGWRPKFYERRRTNSLGHYFTRAEIDARKPLYLSEMLRTIPGVSISQDGTSSGFHVRMRGCRYAPVVWIDGTRMPGTELDDVARVDDVAAMEVYTTPSGVPAQYLDRSNVGCGTILVWTPQ